MGGAEFLHRNTGVGIFGQRNNGNNYKGLYRKWFCVLSFQRNNRYNVINRQRNNENPLYIVCNKMLTMKSALEKQFENYKS